MKKDKGKMNTRKFNMLLFATFLLGVLLITAAYAWFSSSLNAKVKIVNIVVSNDSGLSISLDGINFDNSVEISEENIINNLQGTYPSNTNQWPSEGLRPVSTIGSRSSNDDKFDIYELIDSGYKDRRKMVPYISTKRVVEDKPMKDNYFVAFDIFLKNKTGSPVSDNLYLDNGTEINIENNKNEEVESVLNSTRIGLLKIGSVPLDSSIDAIQNVGCNGNCESIIYEPYSTDHTNLSIERVRRIGVSLFNGQYYPTYAMTNEVSFYELKNSINGQNTNDFTLQLTRFDINRPLFEIPDGITKVRVYVWIEGQDIDSVASEPTGNELSIAINFVKDTAGYDYYNE